MLWAAFFLGLLGSLHCVAMCGPLVLVVNSGGRASYCVYWYHLGRILCYVFLGMLFGILGRGLYVVGLQQSISIASGLLMISFGLLSYAKIRYFSPNKIFYRIISQFKKQLGQQLLRQNRFLVGFLNGFLPCGLLYVALFGAMSMTSLQGGMLYMFFFGLGTIPLLSLMTSLGRRLSKKPLLLKRWIPIGVVFIGLLLLMRGMNLDIPLLSPSHLDLMVRPDMDCVTEV